MSDSPVTIEQPPTAEAVEAAGETAVEVARIEAERDVRLAEISAETTEAVVTADTIEEEQEDAEWHARLGQLEAAMAGSSERLAALEAGQQTTLELLTSIQARLTPPPTETTEPTPEPTSENRPNPPHDPEPAAVGADVTPASQEAPAPEPERRVRKAAHRWT